MITFPRHTHKRLGYKIREELLKPDNKIQLQMCQRPEQTFHQKKKSTGDKCGKIPNMILSSGNYKL
jgi:hypothetical protein